MLILDRHPLLTSLRNDSGQGEIAKILIGASEAATSANSSGTSFLYGPLTAGHLELVRHLLP